jgi:hypothetical protein
MNSLLRALCCRGGRWRPMEQRGCGLTAFKGNGIAPYRRSQVGTLETQGTGISVGINLTSSLITAEPGFSACTGRELSRVYFRIELPTDRNDNPPLSLDL